MELWCNNKGKKDINFNQCINVMIKRINVAIDGVKNTKDGIAKLKTLLFYGLI